MNKNGFLKALASQLSSLPASDKAEIMYDYEEHFSVGVGQGKSEEQVAQGLGNPTAIAKQYKASHMVERAQVTTTTSNVFRAVIAVVGLGFFNLIFILAPFLATVSVILACFVAAIALTMVGPILLLSSLFAWHTYVSVPLFLLENPLALLSLAIGFTSLGLLLSIGSYQLAKWFLQGTVWYLQTNIKLITGGGKQA